MDFSLELKNTAELVDQIVKAQLPEITGQQKTVLEAMQYSVNAGGKRLRPMLMLKSFSLICSDAERKEIMEPILHAAMGAMEMIHTFSLCHDDLPCMDGDKYRRGQESTWYHFGEDMGTLAGDALSLYAFEAVSRAFLNLQNKAPEAAMRYAPDIIRAMYVLAEKSGVSGMLGGQVVDVEMTGKPLTEEQLGFIYRLKTGALLEGSMLVGAILAGANPEELKKLEEIAARVGIAFQIQDDILDETSTQEVLGKPIHSDAENNKTTYVSLHGLKDAEQEVERLSQEAEEGFGWFCNERYNADACAFLMELTKSLIHRKK